MPRRPPPRRPAQGLGAERRRGRLLVTTRIAAHRTSP